MSGTPRPFATPAVPLRLAFGADHEGDAKVTLTGIDVIEPKQSEELALNFEPLWEWGVSSATKGTQNLTATMTVIFHRIEDPADQTGVISVWTQDFEIEITEPLISTDTLKSGAAFFTFLGSGFTIPFLYGVVKDARKKRKE